MRRNVGIESLRLLAMVVITAQHAATVIGHYAWTFIGELTWGQFGVSVFAAIAGYYACSDETSARRWLVARLRRLYPTYWAAMLLSFAGAALTGRSFSFYQVVSQFAGTGYFTHGWDLVNVVSWFVSLLLFCYALTAIAKALGKPVVFLAVCAAISVALILSRSEIALSRHVLTFCLSAIAGRKGDRHLPVAAAVVLALTFLSPSFAYGACALALLWGFSRVSDGLPAIPRVSNYIYEYFLLHGILLAAAAKLFHDPFVVVIVGITAALAGSPLLRLVTDILVRRGGAAIDRIRLHPIGR